MECLNFITKIHTKTDRDYLERVVAHDKAACAEIAKRFDFDYWDGNRNTGYGGYTYDGRWKSLAEDLINHYQLPDDASILDIGCGKGFLLYEFKRLLPNCKITGIDISQYAIDNAKAEIKDRLSVGTADALPFENNSFDLTISINVFHNLYIDKLFKAVQEMERVGKSNQKYIVIEGYRNEVEKVNLMYWQLTCRAFHTPEEWEWLFNKAGYQGDYECIFFE